MNALSINQPWANLITSGDKTAETRAWRTEYRGPLLIVSAQYPRIDPAGMALAVVDLVDCKPVPNYEPGAAQRRARYAWVLANPSASNHSM